MVKRIEMKTLIPYCFRKEEIISKFKNNQQFNNWIKAKEKNGAIKRVRNGLFVSLDSLGIVSSSKFEIASKISKDSFLSHHSAIEFYGLANQVFNSLTVSSSTRFNNFEFEGIDYVFKSCKNFNDVIYLPSKGVRVSSLERTIVDCIKDIDLAGGIEELLNALEMITFLDETKLLTILDSYNEVLLYQKVGYILEQYKERIHLSDSFFEKCSHMLTNQVKYFLDGEYRDISYNARWKLMAPNNLLSRINGEHNVLF